ncbi:MAG: hypothetical protein ACTSXC_07165 [Candidatus Freyarchaeota archaeon]
MGVSTPIASAIVLAGVVVFIGSISSSLLNGLCYFTDMISSCDQAFKVKSRLELSILSVTNNSVEILVNNLGPETVFLVSEGGYNWSSIIISYRSNSAWKTYLVDNYEVLEINVTSTDLSFDPSTHPFVNPGETARIRADMPEGAPEIEVGSPLVAIFTSRFGEVAECEGVR